MCTAQKQLQQTKPRQVGLTSFRGRSPEPWFANPLSGPFYHISKPERLQKLLLSYLRCAFIALQKGSCGRAHKDHHARSSHHQRTLNTNDSRFESAGCSVLRASPRYFLSAIMQVRPHLNNQLQRLFQLICGSPPVSTDEPKFAQHYCKQGNKHQGNKHLWCRDP